MLMTLLNGIRGHIRSTPTSPAAHNYSAVGLSVAFLLFLT